MSAVIFAGPTIAKPDILRLCDAIILPPAAMGDVYRAARRRPRAIGIIDGYFEGAPSVWHKEILWALTEDIAVFGAASMGALRAAELADFGMRGVGDIYSDFVSGKLEDDDEVAVEHGPAETGYLTLSEPLVNMRATIARAIAEGIVSAAGGQALIDLAKQQFYKERSWQALLRANVIGVAPPERDALARWLPANAIDVKRNDACKMVSAIAEFLAAPSETAEPKFAFEWTVMWDKVARSFSTRREIAASDREVDLVLDELRLDPAHHDRVRRGALARKLIAAGSPDPQVPVDKSALRRALARFRTGKGLLTHSALMDWLNENGLDAEGFERLLAEELRLAAASASDRGIAGHVIAELQFAGTYSVLARRAREKQELIGSDGLRQAGHRLHVMQARLWYFEDRLGRPLPDDLVEYAEEAGFADVDALDHAILREFAFCRQSDKAAKASAPDPF